MTRRHHLPSLRTPLYPLLDQGAQQQRHNTDSPRPSVRHHEDTPRLPSQSVDSCVHKHIASHNQPQRQPLDCSATRPSPTPNCRQVSPKETDARFITTARRLVTSFCNTHSAPSSHFPHTVLHGTLTHSTHITQPCTLSHQNHHQKPQFQPHQLFKDPNKSSIHSTPTRSILKSPQYIITQHITINHETKAVFPHQSPKTQRNSSFHIITLIYLYLLLHSTISSLTTQTYTTNFITPPTASPTLYANAPHLPSLHHRCPEHHPLPTASSVAQNRRGSHHSYSTILTCTAHSHLHLLHTTFSHNMAKLSLTSTPPRPTIPHHPTLPHPSTSALPIPNRHLRYIQHPHIGYNSGTFSSNSPCHHTRESSTISLQQCTTIVDMTPHTHLISYLQKSSPPTKHTKLKTQYINKQHLPTSLPSPSLPTLVSSLLQVPAFAMTKAKSSSSTPSKSKTTPPTSVGAVRKKIIIKLPDRTKSTPTAAVSATEPIAVRDYPPGCTPLPRSQHSEPAMPTSAYKRSRSQRKLLIQDGDSDGSMSPTRQTRSTSSRDSVPSNRSTTPSSLPAPATSLAPPAVTLPASPTRQQHLPQPSSTPNPGNIPSPPPPPLSPVECISKLWLSFSVHEYLNTQLGLPECRESAQEALATSLMTDSEVLDFHSCRHAFPHVPQTIYPSVRPDGLPGQYLHLTQIPQGTDIVQTTGLSQSYQIIIRFDSDYHRMTKPQVQEAAIARFAQMQIPLANRYREPVSAIVNRKTHGWLGFIRVDLLNPEIDAIALLKGQRIFALQLQNSEYVVGKIEKGYEFLSTANNRRLQISGSILTSYNSRHLLADLIALCYTDSANAEIVGVAKKFTDTSTADITVTGLLTKKFLLSKPHRLLDQPTQITDISSDDRPNATKADDPSTSILVRGLNIQYSQIQISAALHQLLGARNITNISYNRAQDDALGRHDGDATLKCLNSAVYTTWCSRRAIPLLGKLVDFTPHHRSIAGSSPPDSTRAHDLRPTREYINDAITALKNETPQGPSLAQLQDTIQTGVDNLQRRLSTLSSEVNRHTTTTVETAATLQQAQHAHLLEQLQLLTTASSNYSNHVSGISNALLAGPMHQPASRPPGFPPQYAP